MATDFQLSDTQASTVRMAASSGQITQQAARMALDVARSTMSEAVQGLVSDGLVESTRSGNTNILELTRDGWKAWKDLEAVGGQEPNTGEDADAVPEVDLHNFQVKFKLYNSGELDDAWRERWATGQVQRRTYDPTNGSYVYFTDRWKFRITGEHVIVSLEDSIRARDAHRAKDEAMGQIFRARNWIQDRVPSEIQVGSSPVDLQVEVSRQHLALVRDPFADLVKNHSEVSLQDVRIYDSEDRERLWLDDSNGERHLEAGNAPGENRGFAEDDIEFIRRELYEWMIRNKEEWESLQDIAESRSSAVENALEITSKWMDRWGNVMGYSPELGHPVKVLDSSQVGY